VELIIVYNLELPFNYHLTIRLTVKFINQLQRMIYWRLENYEEKTNEQLGHYFIQ